MSLGVILVFIQTTIQFRFMYRDTNKLRLNVPRDIQGKVQVIPRETSTFLVSFALSNKSVVKFKFLTIQPIIVILKNTIRKLSLIYLKQKSLSQFYSIIQTLPSILGIRLKTLY